MEQPLDSSQRRFTIMNTNKIVEFLRYYGDYGFSYDGYLIIPETVLPTDKHILFLYLNEIGIHTLYIGNFSSTGVEIKRKYTIPNN
jgi:hypothetical protein